MSPAPFNQKRCAVEIVQLSHEAREKEHRTSISHKAKVIPLFAGIKE